jgi:hypothetical protein
MRFTGPSNKARTPAPEEHSEEADTTLIAARPETRERQTSH